MVACPKPLRARLLRMAELRAAGLGWNTIADEVGCRAETCRELTRVFARKWERLYRAAEREVLLEIRAEARMALRNHLRSPDPAVVVAAAKVLFAECRRGLAETWRQDSAPVEEPSESIRPVVEKVAAAPATPTGAEPCHNEPGPTKSKDTHPVDTSATRPRLRPGWSRRLGPRRLRPVRPPTPVFARVRGNPRPTDRWASATNPNHFSRSSAMKKPRKHNYMRKLLAMQARGELTVGVSDVEVAHDDWCRIYKGGYCNCDPDIRVRKLVPRPIPEPSKN